MRIRFLSYCTIFSAESIPDNIHLRLSDRVCFGDLKRSISGTVRELNIRIIVYKGLDMAEKGRSNFCFLNKQEVESFIKSVKFVNPFKFKVSESEFNNTDCFTIDLYFERIDKTPLMFILTWIRYLYEKPFSGTVLDLMRLRKEGLFRGYSNVNLMGIIHSCCIKSLNNNHSIFESGIVPFKNNSNLYRKIHASYDLNSIFRNSGKGCIIDGLDESDTWTSETEYQKRKINYYQYKKEVNGISD